jgi:protoporphyrinogen oxidase
VSTPHVVVLGAGPAGLGAAHQLATRNRARVTVLERAGVVGGNAGSFELAGLRVDYGSHRLHPACDPAVMRDIKALLDGELLDRPRHGRIRLRGRWIHFPLKPLDLALRLPPSFATGVAADSLRKLVAPAAVNGDSMSSVLEAGLGRTICRDFYFPYARKLWGMDPGELAGTQARRRVAAGSLAKMVRKVLTTVPGLKPPGAGRFFYPRRGYGQIAEAYHRAAEAAGARVHFNADIQSVALRPGGGAEIAFTQPGGRQTVTADQVWSTIPITALARALSPAPPPECLDAAARLQYRSMILNFLVLGQDQFTEYDAHYFPELDIPISRLSEPKNYSASTEPRGATVLCAELPCSAGDPVWTATDEALGRLMIDGLTRAGLPVGAPVRQVVTRRLAHAYPIYQRGYEEPFRRLDAWLSDLDGVLTFGRQGLFAHDNTHHALFMAYAAAECLGADGRFDRERWHSYRTVFETHVVED